MSHESAKTPKTTAVSSSSPRPEDAGDGGGPVDIGSKTGKDLEAHLNKPSRQDS